MKLSRSSLACATLLLAGVAHAQTPPAPGAATDESASTLATLVVTATRTPEAADRVPADISVVFGDELRARDSQTMASALALVPGVEAPAGGDAGPSSAVPSFWGLHEFDAFLLVVDGIPWGGAFNPMIATLNMNDVQRIEVLKGSAPVMFGATSFVGVVQEIHYPAGQAANDVEVSYGNYGSARGLASFVLPPVGDYKQSLAIDGESLGFTDKREHVADGKALYRGALDIGGGEFRIDADLTFVRDAPPSPVIRVGSALTTLTPIDANFNPANAAIDQNEYHVALGYERPTALGDWSILASLARSDIRDIRAFLHPDLSGFADSQDQTRHIDDDYIDTHITHLFAGRGSLIVGVDMLYGLGQQTSLNGNSGYLVPLDGSVLPPPTTQIPVNEIGTVDDKRIFIGQYAQLDLKFGDRVDLTGGLRLNEAYEHKISSDFTTPPLALAAAIASRTDVRATETVGLSYKARRERRGGCTRSWCFLCAIIATPSSRRRSTSAPTIPRMCCCPRRPRAMRPDSRAGSTRVASASRANCSSSISTIWSWRPRPGRWPTPRGSDCVASRWNRTGG